MTRPIRVLIVDDQTLVRSGFRLVLEGRDGIDVAGEASNGEEAVSAVRRMRPDVVLMDVRMPVMDGIEATRRILALGGACRVIVLTTFDLDDYVYGAMAAGASGFLLKDVTGDQLAASIRLIATGDALLAPTITRRLIERFTKPGLAAGGRLSSLTAREMEVLKHLARGLSNAELAAELHVEESTVKSHVARVLDKLGLRDRVQAVILAYEAGLVNVQHRNTAQ
ncbi:MAG: response regulator [Candidatus Dormibacteraceae bacterium]